MIIKLGKVGVTDEAAKRPKLNTDYSEFVVDDDKNHRPKSDCTAGHATTVESFPNNASTANAHRWRQYGNKKPKPLKDGTTSDHRLYYKCSSCDSKGCKATYGIVHTTTGTTTEYNESHNHPPLPPGKQRVSFEVKEAVMSQLAVGAKPSVIQRHLVNNASGPISRKDVPTKQQMYNWQHQMVAATLPTGDAITNLYRLHHPHFMRYLQMDSGVSVGFVGENGLSLLSSSKHIVADGTFDLIEDKLILTTLMAYHEGIAIPAAYLVSDLRTQPTYRVFFQKVRELTHGRMDPTGCLMDFEEALANAWQEVFPKCTIMRDFFHLQQANTRWAGKHSLTDLRPEIIDDIRGLWYADTKTDFEALLKTFLTKWDDKAPAYADYFRRIWIQRYPPSEWASYARPKDSPSGSGSIEGHHNRLQNGTMSGFTPKDIDKFANQLWKEEDYYTKMVQDPTLWDEKRKTHLAAVEKHLKQKRITLKNITGSRTTAHHGSTISTSTSTTTTSTTSIAFSATVIDGEDSGVIDSIDADEDSPLHQPSVPRVRLFFSKDPPPRLDIPEEKRCKCGQYKLNTACSGRLCQKCCGQLTVSCSVTNHAKIKPGGYSSSRKVTRDPVVLPPVCPEVLETIKGVMSAGRPCYIAYDNIHLEDGPRKIKPTSWVKHGECFKALCFNTEPPIEKTFNVHKVLRVEDHKWDTSKAQRSDKVDTVSAAKIDTVEAWLKTMNLEEYWPVFKEHGFDDLESISDLNETRLDMLGIAKEGHRIRLLRKAKEWI